MTGWYPCVKEALVDRGWHYNPDPCSPYFDLKWTLRSVDVCQDSLLPNQLTNHFLKNVAITTKVKYCNIKGSILFDKVFRLIIVIFLLLFLSVYLFMYVFVYLFIY